MPYPDVSPNHWAADDIELVFHLGLITGRDNGNFDPEAPVTRAEVAAILARHMRRDHGAKQPPPDPFPYAVARWRPLVSKYFPKAHVENALKIMQCESEGNPNALNPHTTAAGNASGLFQHMPKYWPDRSKAAGFAGADIFDPQANVAVAAWLFKQTMDWRHWECRKVL